MTASPSLPDTLSHEQLGALVDSLLTYDPMDARAEEVEVAGDPVFLAAPDPVPAPLVAVVMRGVVGPPWLALLDGVPERQGVVLVAQGDTLGSIHVVRVSADAVTLRSADSTWTLQLTSKWR
jgi:hypothetical protein